MIHSGKTNKSKKKSQEQTLREEWMKTQHMKLIKMQLMKVLRGEFKNITPVLQKKKNLLSTT